MFIRVDSIQPFFVGRLGQLDASRKLAPGAGGHRVHPWSGTPSNANLVRRRTLADAPAINSRTDILAYRIA